MNSIEPALRLLMPRGYVPSCSNPIRIDCAGSQDAARRGEDVEVRPVVGLVGLAVQGPGELLPVQAAVSSTWRRGLSVAFTSVVGPRGLVAGPAPGTGRGRARRGGGRGPSGIAVGRQVLAPVVFLLFLGGAALASPARLRPPASARRRAGRRPRVPAAGPSPRQRPRPQPMHDPGGVRLAAPVDTAAQDDEEDGQAYRARPAEHQGRPIELQHADVAGADRVPQRPVADPVDLIGEQPIAGEAQDVRAPPHRSCSGSA